MTSSRRTIATFLAVAVILAAIAVGGLSGAAQSQETNEKEPQKWTADDVINTEQAGGFQVSPDGRWAVWVKSIADKEKDGRISNLILDSLTEKKQIELTRGTDSCSNPKWSPNGQLIAFVTTRPAPNAKPAAPGDGPKPQIWLINPFGGEPWPVTDFSRGVSAYEWADVDTVVFAAQEEPTLFEKNIKEKKDSSVVVEDELHAPPVRLFKFAIKAKKFTRVTDNADRIQAFWLSPDGTRAVTIHDRSLRFIYDARIKPAVFLYTLADGHATQIFTDPKFNVREAAWTHDGKGFYATSEFSNHPQYQEATITELYYYDVAAGSPVKVDLGWENGLARGVEVTDTGFITLLANGARNRPAGYAREGNGWRREWITGMQAENIFGFELGKDAKTLLFAYSTASTPLQWYRGTLEGARIDSPVQVTDLNPTFKKKPIGRTEVIKWKGALDEEVEGILYYPHNYEQGKKYPLVVMIHGGPAGADFDAWSDSWAYPHNLMAQRGAFVFKPNYHGSSNYGLKWVESIGGGKYYDLEVPDVEKGVDSLIARGMVDPDKLGVMGWSNGAILTIALTITTTRYKVASAGAGDVDWTSDWGNAHFGAAFDNYYFGKSPIEDPLLYIKKSPFYKLDRVRTPTIIFFGTEDTNVPTEQGWLHYRALQQIGKTDVRFILFPGEKHSPQKLVHQRRKVEEELAWFDKHLFNSSKEENEAFKPDSPLAAALKLKNAKHEGPRYGIVRDGCLIPETVKHDSLEIGRFEITRAQYAHFDKSYTVEPGKENYPANNISFEKAKAYCEWLSQFTGQTYRLPNEDEAEQLYSGASAAENTLDFWAGYPLNPDDTERLRKKLAELGGGAPLLKEAGSFKGGGTDQQVFDLGGNVAEWVIDKDGAGRAMGGSADTPADAKMRGRKAAAEYVGFRVIKGPPAAP
ncbi:MAG TPA: prolyl oligopeptidase family serine peptidase, partial [Blastocatellia bacterium]|nr:prolyl oligopeptidase family serine peptidase [Blastocatellia bacterium]